MGLIYAIGSAVWHDRKWRRLHRRLAASREPLSLGDFSGALAGQRVSPEVSAEVWKGLKPYYNEPLQPDPTDALDEALGIDPEELEDIVERLFDTLGLPKPRGADPERVPLLLTVSDLARYMEERLRLQAAGSAHAG